MINNKKMKVYSLENDFLKVDFISKGGRILNFYVKKDKKIYKNIVLGFNGIEDIINDKNYTNVLVGPVCNRIKSGEFILNDRKYKLEKNDKGNTLHSGNKGFSNQTFSVTIKNNEEAILKYKVKDLEDGFPGDRSLIVYYYLEENNFIIIFNIISTKDTIFSPTMHMYFNLDLEEDDDILKHFIKVNSNEVEIPNKDLILKGNTIPVKESILNLKIEKKIGTYLKKIKNNFNMGSLENRFSNNLSDLQDIKELGIKGLDYAYKNKDVLVNPYFDTYLDESNSKYIKDKFGYPPLAVENEDIISRLTRKHRNNLIDEFIFIDRRRNKNYDVCLKSKNKKLELNIISNMTHCHIYSGDYLGGIKNQYGKEYKKNMGIAIEPELRPNDINIVDKSPMIIPKGEEKDYFIQYTVNLYE